MAEDRQPLGYVGPSCAAALWRGSRSRLSRPSRRSLRLRASSPSSRAGSARHWSAASTGSYLRPCPIRSSASTAGLQPPGTTHRVSHRVTPWYGVGPDGQNGTNAPRERQVKDGSVRNDTLFVGLLIRWFRVQVPGGPPTNRVQFAPPCVATHGPEVGRLGSPRSDNSPTPCGHRSRALLSAHVRIQEAQSAESDGDRGQGGGHDQQRQ